MSTAGVAKSRTEFLNDGKIGHVIRVLSLPVIGSMMSIALFQIVDSLFIGALGTSALGAVSVAFPLFTVVGGLGQVFGTGAGSWISRLLGAGKHSESEETASAAIIGVSVVGLAISAVVVSFLRPLLVLLGGTETIIPFAVRYSRFLIIANLFTMANITMSSIARAEGNARRGMYSFLLSSGLNIVLDPLLIFGFDLGIAGAGLATLIAQIVSFAFLVSFHVRGANVCRIGARAGIRGFASIGRTIGHGMPSFFLQILGAGAIALTNNAAMHYGDEAVAAVGLAFRVFSLGMFPIYGFVTGFQPVAGYAYGAGNYDRVFDAMRTALRWALSFSIAFAGIVVAFAPHILMGFTHDDAVVRIGARMLRAVSFLFPLFGTQIVMAVLFQAIGRAALAAVIVVSRQGLFFVPVILLLPRVLGLDGIILSQPIADILTSLLTALLGATVLRQLRNESRVRVPGIDGVALAGKEGT